MAGTMEVGDRLRAARERCGMTIGDLAAKMGVHIATVTLWENRKNRRQMGTRHVHKAADVLGIRVSELLGETEPAGPPTRLTTQDLAETQLLRLFRLMPEELKLFQLAQFFECANVGKPDQARGHNHRQRGVPTGSSVDSESR
jgi:transcriptional regulator with XRE-family HTH domain